jgi:hypothetical protein
MLKLRHEAGDSPDRFQVYTGQVRIGVIYKTSGNQWYWGLNGVQNGPGPFNNGFRTLDDAKVEICRPLGRLAQGCRAERRHAHSAAQRLGFWEGLTYIPGHVASAFA